MVVSLDRRPPLTARATPRRTASATAPILVVDDDATNRDLLSRRLIRANYEVVTAADGQEALEKAETSEFSLVLLDVMMPGIGGLEVLQQLRGQYSADDLPIIMVTANDSSADIVDALRQGANDYVVKPIDFDILLARTQTQLQLGHARAELARANESLEQTVAKRTMALRASRQRFRTLYDNSPAIFLTIDASFQVVSANDYGLDRLGFERDSLVGLPSSFLFPDETSNASNEFFKQCLESPDRVFRREATMTRESGEPLLVNLTARGVGVDDGDPSVLLVCEDKTELHRLESALSFEMSHDSDTGLVNRSTLEERVNELILGGDDSTGHSIIVVRIDRSELIGEAMGRAVVDEEIRRVAAVLSGMESDHVVPARVSGNFLGVLCHGDNSDAASSVGARIVESVRELEFFWGEASIPLTASVGIAGFDRSAANAGSVLRQAEIASERASKHGGDQLYVYNDDDDPVVRRLDDLEWLTRVQAALREDRFCLHAQRICPATENAEEGLHYEVLVRMLDSDGGLIPPGQFLPIVERYNLGAKLDRWVLRSTMAWLRDNPQHVDNLSLCSINLSGPSLSEPEILAYLLRELRKGDIPAHKICFEITESMAISDLSTALQFMHELQQLGCRFALDDFGTGVSSFAYLQNLPADIVKIDGTFVRGIADSATNRAVVNSINEIAHAMGKQTVAEFVDCNESLEVLKEVGVDYVQGYLLDEPGPLDRF